MVWHLSSSRGNHWSQETFTPSHSHRIVGNYTNFLYVTTRSCLAYIEDHDLLPTTMFGFRPHLSMQDGPLLYIPRTVLRNYYADAKTIEVYWPIRRDRLWTEFGDGKNRCTYKMPACCSPANTNEDGWPLYGGFFSFTHSCRYFYWMNVLSGKINKLMLQLHCIRLPSFLISWV